MRALAFIPVAVNLWAADPVLEDARHMATFTKSYDRLVRNLTRDQARLRALAADISAYCAVKGQVMTSNAFGKPDCGAAPSQPAQKAEPSGHPPIAPPKLNDIQPHP